jgi:hypothetical protein
MLILITTSPTAISNLTDMSLRLAFSHNGSNRTLHLTLSSSFRTDAQLTMSTRLFWKPVIVDRAEPHGRHIPFPASLRLRSRWDLLLLCRGWTNAAIRPRVSELRLETRMISCIWPFIVIDFALIWFVQSQCSSECLRSMLEMWLRKITRWHHGDVFFMSMTQIQKEDLQGIWSLTREHIERTSWSYQKSEDWHVAVWYEYEAKNPESNIRGEGREMSRIKYEAPSIDSVWESLQICM